jgi:hypothetical protein
MNLKISGQLIEKFLRENPLEEFDDLIKFQVSFLKDRLCNVIPVLYDEI